MRTIEKIFSRSDDNPGKIHRETSDTQGVTAVMSFPVPMVIRKDIMITTSHAFDLMK